jgi:dienelactone hydrolase
MNVAFRGTEEEAKGLSSSAAQDSLGAGDWWEDKQAAALTAGDISAFGTVVNVDELKPGVTRADSIAPGLHERIYRSLFTGSPGEGVVPMPGGSSPCSPIINFLGQYQPYGIYVPAQAGPHGLQFVMHGCDANHASLINSAGMQQRFGEDLNRILLVPLGRGPIGWYTSGLSERDVLDAWADVLSNYEVDRDQMYSGGYSMGGYGTLRFAELYPDQFAGAVNWVGFTGDLFNTPLPGNPIPAQTAGGSPIGSSRVGADFNVIELLQNMSHVPVANLYSGADELVHANTGLAMQNAYMSDAPDVPYVFYLHPGAEHLTYALLDDWTKEASFSAGRTRVHNPAQVIYTTDAAFDAPNFGIRHNRAYWVSQIAAIAPGQSAVNLTSSGCGTLLPVLEDDSPAAGPDPVPWESTSRSLANTAVSAQTHTLEGTLSNVASLTLDVAGACLAGTPTYQITVVGTGTDLNLSDGRTRHLVAGANTGTF